MSENWSYAYLGDVIENHDARRIPVKELDRNVGPYPYYGASGIIDWIDNYIFDGEYLLIAEDGENLRTRQTSIAFMATGKFWVNNHAHVVTGNDKANTKYLMYALSQTNIEGYLTGSAMPKLTQGNLHRIIIPLPPIPEQRAIAHILGSLDDKIELNRRMNAMLEATARALFKSWFVDFDPVHYKARGEQPPGMDAETAALFPDSFEDSPLGLIPNGWEVTTLGNVIEIFDSQRIPLSSGEREQRQGVYPYYGAVSVVDYIDDYIFDGIYLLISEDGAYVTDKRGYPTTQYVWGKFWVNNHAHIVRGTNTIATEQLLLALQHIVISPFITGAVQPKLSQQNMKSVPFLLPYTEINAQFQRATEPLFTKIRLNTEELKTLIATRDTLLPKLVSGELRVGDVEHYVEEMS